jgi:hypothetical protein
MQKAENQGLQGRTPQGEGNFLIVQFFLELKLSDSEPEFEDLFSLDSFRQVNLM